MNAVTTYRIQVFAENGVSHLQIKSTPEYADITVTTEASVTSTVINIRVTSVKSTEISLTWDVPSVNDGSDLENDLIETYEVCIVIILYFLYVIEKLSVSFRFVGSSEMTWI